MAGSAELEATSSSMIGPELPKLPVLAESGDGKAAEQGSFVSRWSQALKELNNEEEEQFQIDLKTIGDRRTVLANLLNAVNKRKEECLRKRWKIRIKDRTIILRDVFEKLCVWIERMVVSDSDLDAASREGRH